MASISNLGAIAACDAMVDRCDAGATESNPVLRFYDGTPPANADAALSGNTLLAELAMSNPAFGAAADANPGGIATANAISDDTAADANGTASFARIYDKDSPRACALQLTVTATGGGGEVEVNTVSFVAGVNVSVTSLTFTQPES